MPKELRITTIITIPDGVFEEAVAIAKAEPFITAFHAALLDVVADDALRHDVELVTPRPRGAKDDAEGPSRGSNRAIAAATEIPGVKSRDTLAA